MAFCCLTRSTGKQHQQDYGRGTSLYVSRPQFMPSPNLLPDQNKNNSCPDSLKLLAGKLCTMKERSNLFHTKHYFARKLFLLENIYIFAAGKHHRHGSYL